MFLHIGENITIFRKDIIAMIDKKTVENCRNTKQFIDNMIREGYLCNDNVENIKTYILTCSKKIDSKKRKPVKKYGLYVSSISSTTLSKRNKNIETRLEVK